MRLIPSCLLSFGLSIAACDASTLQPPILPLIVRNPYLSTWLQNARDVPWSRWPMFYTGQEIGFGVLAGVPDSDTVYPLLGRPHDSLGSSDDGYNVSYATYVGSTYDASVTNLTYKIPSPELGHSPADLILSFLSPITPTSTLRQSIPASYLTVYVSGDFDINVYIDLNGQWVSGDRGSHIEWKLERSDVRHGDSLKTWSFKRRVEQLFTEWGDRAEWGSLLFTGPSDAHHESGVSAELRKRFAGTGSLRDEVDEDFRAIMDEEPVFAFSKSFKLGRNSSDSESTSSVKSESALFTIAHVRDPVVQFASARGLTYMRPLWKTWLLTDDKLTDFHYNDFSHAQKLAQNYSDQLAVDAYQSGSDSYVDIVALSARQVMGATDFSGTEENPLLFLKEISSNGNSQTIDVIFPAFPFFLYTQPRWLAYLLDPLIEHMSSGQYPNENAMHDLGYHYPNLTGHSDGNDEYMPVESCGDILHMGLAVVNSLIYGSETESQSIWAAEGGSSYKVLEADDTSSPFALTSLEERNGVQFLDNMFGGSAKGVHQAQDWLRRAYGTWKGWTRYLVKYSLEPQNQLSTDDFAGWLPLQTNLALKGMVGIKAMSKMAEIMGEKHDAKYLANVSESYVARWQELGISRDGTHAKLAYDWYGSWTTLYTLYSDALLCFHPSSGNVSDLSFFPSRNGEVQAPLHSDSDSASSLSEKDNFIPSSVYQIQSDWYAAVMQKYGLPLDSRHLYTKSDWEFFVAAVTGPKVRAEILDRVAKWLNETVTDRPFTDLYETEGEGGFPGPNFFARPVVGGHFAFLSLERACGGRAMEGLKGLR